MAKTPKKPGPKVTGTRAAAKRGIPEAVEMRKPKVCLGGIEEVYQKRRAGLIGLGQLVWGERWRTELAKALGAELGRKIAPSEMAHWITGTRPISERVSLRLHDVARRQASIMRCRAEMIANDDWYWAVECQDGSVVVPARLNKRVRNESRDGTTRVISGDNFEDSWIDLRVKAILDGGDA